jgi:glucose/arabinose dehydrogenase
MKFSRYSAFLVLLALMPLFFAHRTSAQRITYEIREIASGFNVPWEIRMAPDGWLFFTERPGRFSKLHPATGETRVLLRADDCVLWHEAGMLGFDFHPNFPDSPFIYIGYVYNQSNNKAGYGLFRFTYTGDSLIERVQLFGPGLANFAHNGSRVVIRDGKIFFSNGEIDRKELAQDLSSPHGKINRINLDGSIPEDNPFPGSATWSYGHRNPQGLDFGPTGILYSSEHGDATDDEINLIEKGQNYGWPYIHGFCDSLTDHPRCEDLNIREPLAAFTPTLAASDVAYFDHTSVPEWKHSLLMASLRDQSLHQFKLSDDGQQILSWERYNLQDNQGELCGRLRSVCLTRNGRIFLSTGNAYAKEEKHDKIFELVRKGVEQAQVRLLHPLNESVLSEGSHDLSWTRAFIGATYELQIASSFDFDKLSIVHQREYQDTLVTISDLALGIRYFWRVRETITNGPWTEGRTFIEEKSKVDTKQNTDPSPPDLSTLGRSIIIIPRTESLTASVEVFDLLGRKMASKLIVGLEPGLEDTLGEFERGAYFVRVSAGRNVSTRRVLVK